MAAASEPDVCETFQQMKGYVVLHLITAKLSCLWVLMAITACYDLIVSAQLMWLLVVLLSTTWQGHFIRSKFTLEGAINPSLVIKVPHALCQWLVWTAGILLQHDRAARKGLSRGQVIGWHQDEWAINKSWKAVQAYFTY